MSRILARSMVMTLLLAGVLITNFVLAQEEEPAAESYDQTSNESLLESASVEPVAEEPASQEQSEKTPGPPAEERSLMQIEVKPDERIPKGKSAFIHGETDAIGDKFLVEGIDVMQPVYVGVYTKNADDKIRVRIVKDNWDKAEREENTDSTGKAEFTFRTYDGFKIGIDAKEDTEYQIVVWVGDESSDDVPAIAVPASDYVERQDKTNPDGNSKSDEVSFSYLELGLIGLVFLLLVGSGVAFMLLRKKK